VAALEARFWQNVVEAVGRPDLADRQHDGTATAELETLFATRPRAAWLALLEHGDTCVSPVQSLSEVAADEQVAARGMLVPVPGEPETRQVGTPITGAGARAAVRPAVAAVGGDTAGVLRAAGFDDDAVVRLARWSSTPEDQTRR
jgi:crotonobetainyl-CoA:carnitine CoA-transferase CaiB-like acyl-CoA transferase